MRPSMHGVESTDRQEYLTGGPPKLVPVTDPCVGGFYAGFFGLVFTAVFCSALSPPRLVLSSNDQYSDGVIR